MLKTGFLPAVEGALCGQKFASGLTSLCLNIEMGGAGEGCRTMLHVLRYVIHRNTWVHIYLQTFVRHLSGCTRFSYPCGFCVGASVKLLKFWMEYWSIMQHDVKMYVTTIGSFLFGCC